MNSLSSRLFAAISAIALVMGVLVTGLLMWSAKEVDRKSQERDRAIVSLVLAQGVDRVAHVQESSTVWDNAVIELARRPLDLDWVDQNIGLWFNEYAGHDEVYILDPRDRPIYAMRDGKRLDAQAYSDVKAQVQPLVDRLRAAGEEPPKDDDELAMLSPGEADLVMMHGHPAIVSAKPVVSDTGEIKQKRGTEATHISIVYLDGKLISRLSHQYDLAGGRYARAATLGSGEASVPLTSRNGHVIGYFIWRPFAPGEAVRSYIAPAVISALALAGAAILLLVKRLGLRTHDLEESRARAHHLALHDVLTGLPNRAMFERKLEQALEQSRHDGSRLAVLYIDLDRFKQVNDTLGHPAGDQLIVEVAARLSADVRHYDTVARLGGDEFAIILVDLTGNGIVKEICARIVEDLRRPFDLAGAQSFIGASIGVAVSPDHGVDRTELVRKADIALYRAKMDGRNRFTIFNPRMDDAVRSREEIDRDLRQALSDGGGQLKLHYQPVFSAKTGEMNAVEALVRWDHPTRGVISPAEFVPLAEESGLIEPLGTWIFQTAMNDARRWPGIRLSVNVSPVQIRNRAFPARLLKMLKEAGMKPGQLELEITETALMDASSGVTDTLAGLRQRGVLVALDDFGTGYSSLSHIRDIAVDRVKIDRSFVDAIESGNGRALIQAIVTLGLANGLKLTAEGVETEAQRDFLKQAGCDELQGFLLARPMSARDIDALCLGRRRGDRRGAIEAA
ncbi:MAG: putative bifunctional diguanylate cyclase/phosphodiesterase [Sphingobium sp.]